MGMSDCNEYMMEFGHDKLGPRKKHMVIFHIPGQRHNTLTVVDSALPANVSIGNFKDIWWICGKHTYIFTPWMDRMLLYGHTETPLGC